MGRRLTAFANQPAHRQTVTLGGEQFDLRLTWRARLGAWYADLWRSTGEAVWLGQRVSTGWPLGFGLGADGQPEGYLLVRGPAEYRRDDLGGTVEIVFYTADELAAAQAAIEPDDDGVTVVIPPPP